jgi:hypothetical protein
MKRGSKEKEINIFYSINSKKAEGRKKGRKRDEDINKEGERRKGGIVGMRETMI